ncbi:MAG TPA: hypothetical protein VGF15_06250 [Solirubrobacteraceae bacterium]
MFTRSQPREVYRVYGEDDFFSEAQENPDGYPQPKANPDGYPQPEPAAPAYEEFPPLAPALPHQPEPAPPVYEEPAPLAPAYTPEPQPAHEFSEQQTSDYSPPAQEYQMPATAVYGGLPSEEEQHFDELAARSDGVYGASDPHRRTVGMLALAALLGLLVGLLAISLLHSGGSTHTTPPAPAAATIPQQVLTTARSTPLPTDHSTKPRHANPVRVVRHSPRVVVRRATARTHAKHTNRRRSQPTPAPSSPPAVPASAPAESYAPPSSQNGPEFGFEN